SAFFNCLSGILFTIIDKEDQNMHRRLIVLMSILIALLGQLPAQTTKPAPWSAKTERTVGGPEADLVVRTGDINNLGFGWPQGFDPFSGNSTPPHKFPWDPAPGEPDRTDRIMLGSAIDPTEALRDIRHYNSYRSDGYSGMLSDCEMLSQGQPCKE